MHLLRVVAVDRVFRYFVRRKRRDRPEVCTKHRTILTRVNQENYEVIL
jgi:hypothetical protein